MLTTEVYFLIIVCQIVSALLGGILGAYLYRIYVRHHFSNIIWRQQKSTNKKPGLQPSASPFETVKKAQSLLDSTNVTYSESGEADTQMELSGKMGPSPMQAESEMSFDSFRPKSSDRRIPQLPGRSEFTVLIKRKLIESHQSGTKPCVGLIRIDGFAQLRRDHGFSTASLVTQAIATFLNDTTRGNDSVAQYDDSTFGLLISNADRNQAVGAGQRLRRTIATYALATCEAQIRFTVSIGMALADEGDTEASIIERAETALREATFAGGNCVLYTENGKSEILSGTSETVLAE